MKKMLKSYERDLRGIEGRIDELKKALQENKTQNNFEERISILTEEREELLYAIAMIKDYMYEVESRGKGVA